MSQNDSPQKLNSSFVAPNWVLLILERTQDGIVVESLDGQVLLWNKGAERMFGWTAEEVLHCPAKMNYRNVVRGPNVSFLDALKDGQWHGSVSRQAKSGAWVEVETRVSVLRDADGVTAAFLVVNTDVTEKKAIEEQFYQSQRLDGLGALAGGIAHDLNNLLQPLFFGLDLLGTTRDLPDAPKIIADMSVSSRRCAALVRQLLMFARGGPNEGSIFDIRMIIEEIRVLVDHTFPKNIKCHFALPAGHGNGWMDCNPTHIHQILINLCVNARDALSTGGNLWVGAEARSLTLDEAETYDLPRTRDYLQLTVEDDGHGMPPEVLERIFTPFFTTKGEGKGTGLGLYTVRSIVRNMGGFMLLASEVGRGTKIQVVLPAHPLQVPHGDWETERVSESENPLPGHGETILVIDDERAVLSATARALQHGGYSVIEAENGKVAVDIYKGHAAEISLVVCDMAMPVMDGAQALVELRKINPALRSVSASGLTTNGREGTAYFIAKPYTAKELLRVIGAALQT